MIVIRARWYPASAVLPDRPSPWLRCLILAADNGLHIFRRRSEVADWHSSIHWDVTTLPESDRKARNGFSVHTDTGLVVVTLGSGCRCGALGSWRDPSWSWVEEGRA